MKITLTQVKNSTALVPKKVFYRGIFPSETGQDVLTSARYTSEEEVKRMSGLSEEHLIAIIRFEEE